MKMQKSVIFVKKSLKINIWKVKKNSVSTKIPLGLQNGSNYDYHFTIKEIAEKFGTRFTCLE